MTLYNVGDILAVVLKDPQLNTKYEAVVKIKEVTTNTTKGISTYYRAVIDSITQTKPNRVNLLNNISEAKLKSVTRNAISLGKV